MCFFTYIMKKFAYTLIAAVIFFFSFQAQLLADTGEVHIKSITGLVQVQAPGGEWDKARPDQALTPGDKVRSFLESSAVLVFSDGSEFQLRENTALDIKDISREQAGPREKTELKLNLGSLHYKVPPKKEKTSEYKIHSSTSIVGITGTEGVMTARGGFKATENILIEGATYNTDDQGHDGQYQNSGNIFMREGGDARVFNAEVGQEARDRMALDQASVALIDEVVALYKSKMDEGYRVTDAGEQVDQAFFYLEKRAYDLVDQAVGRAKDLLEAARKNVIPDGLDGEIAAARGEVRAKEEQGYDVSRPYVLIARAQSYKQSGYFGEISPILTQVRQRLAQLTDAGAPLSGGTESLFTVRWRDVQSKVLDKEKQGFAIDEIKSMLRQSRVFYERDERPAAYRLLEQAEHKLSLALKDVFSD